MTFSHLSDDPADPAFGQDPYPFYDRARKCGDFFFWDSYQMPCATSWRAVDSLLRDRRFGRERPVEQTREVPPHLYAYHAFEKHSMLEMEPPNHTRLRGLVMRAFTSRAVEEMAPTIRNLCRDLIREMQGGDVDLLKSYCEQIPVITIARLLGVPDDMAPQLLRWSHDMVAIYQANRTPMIEHRTEAATRAFSDFMATYIDKRRKSPGNDLLTRLIAAEEDGARLNTDELIATTILLLNAGHEATVHSFGNGIKTLLKHGDPAGRDLLPANINRTIEETLRFDPPLHMFTRFVYEDVTLFGHKLSAGQEVGLLLAAANRDPEVYPNANTFDPTRQAKAHTSFGAGVHFCIGAPLARLEMQIGLPMLFEAFPDLAVNGPLRYADRYHFHGLERLPVSLGSGG